MPEKTHVPVRQCLGCGERLPKSSLIRVLRTPDGTAVLDTARNSDGRGAYICGKDSCISRLRKSRRIDRVLGVGVPDEVWDGIARITAGSEKS